MILPLPWIRFRFDIQNGGPIHHVQSFNANRRSLDIKDFEKRHSNRIRAKWRMAAKNPHFFIVNRRLDSHELLGKLGTFMEMEDNKNLLAGPDFSESFQIGLINF